MKKALGIALVLGIVAVAGPTSAHAGTAIIAKTYRLSAMMNTRQVVTPANKPWKAPTAVMRAKGIFTGTVTVSAKKRSLTWQITFSGLGREGVEIADIHLGKPGRFGQFLVRLCGPCKSGQRGVRTVQALAAQALTSSDAWVTVITDKYPNGVIRGQVLARHR